MALFEEKWKQLAEIQTNVLSRYVAPGEPLLGGLQATRKKSFSNKVFLIGVTPHRIMLVPVNRKWEPDGDALSFTRAEIDRASVDGMGGGVRHLIGDNAGEIWFDARGERYKLMALGGGLDSLITGAEQTDGKGLLIEFLLGRT
jgi:hypothetical protein